MQSVNSKEPNFLQALRIASTSAWRVGSLVEVTWLQPRAIIFHNRVLHSAFLLYLNFKRNGFISLRGCVFIPAVSKARKSTQTGFFIFVIKAV